MEGDRAPIFELFEVRKRHNAMLMIDEAHALGVFGAKGEGIIDQAMANEADVIMGTFGKALGGYGAFISVSKQLRQFLLNRARTFIFSAALPPPVIGANLAAVKLLDREPERRNWVCKLASELRRSVKEDLGFNIMSESQIVPIILGHSRKALQVTERLMDAGFFVKAIRPPTVPEGTARIRLSVNANHSLEDVHRLVEALSNGI
jgi:7-keto-8-aminopelargonate synthetase-like enzyme